MQGKFLLLLLFQFFLSDGCHFLFYRFYMDGLGNGLMQILLRGNNLG